VAESYIQSLTEFGNAWPVQCQTYGYLPSRRASPPIGRYQFIPPLEVKGETLAVALLLTISSDLQFKLSTTRVNGQLDGGAERRHTSPQLAVITARRMCNARAQRGVCYGPVSVCLSVCPSRGSVKSTKLNGSTWLPAQRLHLGLSFAVLSESRYLQI